MAWMARLNTKQIIAVSLETAMQNASIAVLILQVMISGRHQRTTRGCSHFRVFSEPLPPLCVMTDDCIESFFTPPVQPGVPVWRHGPALCYRLPPLQVNLSFFLPFYLKCFNSSMGPMNLFVFAIFKTTDIVRRNWLKPSSEDEQTVKQANLQENRSRSADLQDVQSAYEGDLQRSKKGEGIEAVYDNRVFSTNE